MGRETTNSAHENCFEGAGSAGQWGQTEKAVCSPPSAGGGVQGLAIETEASVGSRAPLVVRGAGLSSAPAGRAGDASAGSHPEPLPRSLCSLRSRRAWCQQAAHVPLICREKRVTNATNKLLGLINSVKCQDTKPRGTNYTVPSMLEPPCHPVTPAGKDGTLLPATAAGTRPSTDELGDRLSKHERRTTGGVAGPPIPSVSGGRRP